VYHNTNVGTPVVQSVQVIL